VSKYANPEPSARRPLAVTLTPAPRTLASARRSAESVEGSRQVGGDPLTCRHAIVVDSLR